MQTTGQRILTRRLQLHMSQDHLAQRIGVTQAALSRWETDQRLPQLGNLRPLAQALNTTVESLLPGQHNITNIMTIEQLATIAQQLENTAATIRQALNTPEQP